MFIKLDFKVLSSRKGELYRPRLLMLVIYFIRLLPLFVLFTGFVQLKVWKAIHRNISVSDLCIC